MTSVFLCSPVYRTMMPEVTLSMLRASMTLEANGYTVTMPEFLTECPSAHFARTELLGRFLHSQCDIEFSFDDDVEFDSETALDMCEALRTDKADVVGAAYSMHRGERFAVEYLPDTRETKRFQSFRIGQSRFIEVASVGTGVFAFSRRTVLSMIDKCPEAIVGPRTDPLVMLFDYKHVVRQDGVTIPRSEDYVFCDYARKAGLRVHCCTTAKTKHYARYPFAADMDRQLVEGGAMFDESGLLPEEEA